VGFGGAAKLGLPIAVHDQPVQVAVLAAGLPVAELDVVLATGWMEAGLNAAEAAVVDATCAVATGMAVAELDAPEVTGKGVAESAPGALLAGVESAALGTVLARGEVAVGSAEEKIHQSAPDKQEHWQGKVIAFLVDGMPRKTCQQLFPIQEKILAV
jgi:hypothetical protein